MNQTIEELTIQVKEYLIQINQLNLVIEDSNFKYKQLEEAYHSLKEESTLTIQRLTEEIDLLKAELANQASGLKEWEKEKKELVEKYERELK